MFWVSVVVCLFTLCQASNSCTAESKPEPVDLVYSCLRVTSEPGGNDDVPIILIHGMSSFKEVWKGVNEVLALKTGKRVCIVDLRNHGDSPWSNETDTATLAEDIKHLMDKLNIPKAVLLGHSLGGKTAVHLALTYPERVDKVVIEDMRPNGMSPEGLAEVVLYSKMFIEIIKFVPQGVSEKEAKEIFLKSFNEYLAKNNATVFYDDPEMFPIKCSEGKCRWGANTILFEMLANDYKSLLPDSFGRFDGPALFMYGTESNFKVGDDESNIKKLFPNAKLVGVKGAGHIVHTFPEFMTEVIKFINEK